MSRFEIKTDRLVLRPLGAEYLETTNLYALDPENTKYMCNLPNENSEETLHFLKYAESEWEMDDPEDFEFAVLYNGIHIGAVSIFLEDGVGELGWIVNRKYQGNGFAYEAAKAVIEYFSEKGCSRFIAHCDTENVASYRLMEKLGMTRTAEYGGRRNRSGNAETFEYQYELELKK